MTYQLAPLPVTMNYLKGHFLLFENVLLPRLGMSVLCTVCLHMNRKAHVAFNFKLM